MLICLTITIIVELDYLFVPKLNKKHESNLFYKFYNTTYKHEVKNGEPQNIQNLSVHLKNLNLN